MGQKLDIAFGLINCLLEQRVVYLWETSSLGQASAGVFYYGLDPEKPPEIIPVSDTETHAGNVL